MSSLVPSPSHAASEAPAAASVRATAPRRWTLHGLNNGRIFGWTVTGVRFLPRALTYFIGHLSAWVAWRLMPQTNAAIADNLRAVLPEASARELNARALATYRCYNQDTIDFLRALSASDRELAGAFDTPPESAALFEGLASAGRGAIIVCGHYGNWEIGSILMRRVLKLPLTVVAMREADPDVNRLRNEIRTALGVDTIEVRQSLDTALQLRRLLNEGRFVALLIDRHLGKDRVRVDFFGRSTWFLRTPALMAYLTGAPLVPCVLERIGPGRFRALPGERIDIERDKPRDEAIARATERVAAWLETRIRLHPERWYHFYRYWDAQRDDYTGLER